MATQEEKEFMVLAVKLLFRRIEEGKLTFARDRVPQTLRALAQVQFKGNGDPIFETITGPVRALANMVYTQEIEHLEKEAEERERNSPVHDLLGTVTEINDEVLRGCNRSGDFSRLAFELYKEAGIVLAVSSHSYSGETPGEEAFGRNQAICAGLLVRITKFMIAVTQLVATSDSGDRGDVVLGLNRCIMESSVNLKFLVFKNEGRFFDQFVEFSLGPERELYDTVQANIRERGGRELPIEQRMLRSIERICRLSGVSIEDVPVKHREWGGGLRERLKALDLEAMYVAVQRIPSHAIHGTWVDLLLHHLEEKEDRFIPDPSWSLVDPRSLSPVCMIVLDSARSYLERFFGDIPELRPLYRRMEDLDARLTKLDRAHEEWFGRQRPDAGGHSQEGGILPENEV